jgi:Viral coat protein P2 N-terminal domain
MRFIRLPQLQNVGPGNRVTLRLPLGQVYEKIYLALAGNITSSLISNIVLRLNNKEFIRWATMADMNAFNGYRGNQTNSAYVVFDFTERLAKEEIGMKLGTIAATQEAGVQDFTIEFDLGTYTNSAASTITGYADVDNPSANSIIQRVQYSQKTIAAAAEEQVYVPFGQQGQQVKRLIIKHTNLESVRIRRDGVDVYESIPVAMANIRQQDFGRTPQSGYHVIDLMPDSLQSNALNTAQVLGPDGPKLVTNLDVRVKTTAADTLTIYTESYSLNSML